MKLFFAGAALVATATACAPTTGPSGNPDPPELNLTPTGGDVVISVGFSRFGTEETHYVTCGPSMSAEPEYRVIVSREYAYSIPDGQPCPDGPRRPTAKDAYPELYEELKDATR